MTETDIRVPIQDAAELVNRKMGTLRKWEREGVLPPDLLPQRDERNRRWWTPLQVEQIREWIKSTDRRPGKGLPYYDPSFDQVEAQVQRMRGPRPQRA